MSNGNRKDLNCLLDTRGLKGKDLARALDKSEAVVSNWRRGLVPGPSTRAQIYEALGATDEEIAALGWEQETANA